jgi:predicted secreted protein
MGRFITKRLQNMKPQKKHVAATNNTINESTEQVMMTTEEKVAAAQEVLGGTQVKRLKKDKGLIERTENSKTILTEDNKELLKD